MRLRGKSCVRVFFVAGLSILISACGVKTMYEWNGYNNHLLSYYKHPEELNKFSGKLYEGIQKAEVTGTVPPGIYAEYGYVMLSLNDTATAAIYFSKERDKWPESRFLMDKALLKIAKISPPKETEVTEENNAEGGTK